MGEASVAERVAAAIEASVCEPADQCRDRFCPDCIRWRQAKADAATARRIGAGERGATRERAIAEIMAATDGEVRDAIACLHPDKRRRLRELLLAEAPHRA